VPDLLGSAGREGSASVRCRRRIAASSAIHSAVMSGRMPWLTKWTLARSWGPARLAALDRFLAKLVTLPYRERVARHWGPTAGRRAASRSPTPSQRHLDRYMLPGPGPPPGHPQHQGLHRLRPARRSTAHRLSPRPAGWLRAAPDATRTGATRAVAWRAGPPSAGAFDPLPWWT
jgi:hypothetical protein